MSKLDIIPLGGMGNVTQNMYLYVYEDEILIMDCGIGFPDVYMPGADILIPDIYYLLQLLDRGKKIVGMILSHGHDDHIGATPYILPELPDQEFPIYGSPLTAGFAEQRMTDGGVKRSVTILEDRQGLQIGSYFKITPYAMTHSVPDTKHFTIETPAGLVYHGTDFKLDKNPVDGVKPDFESFQEIGQRRPLCMLVDCLRVERSEWTPSESTVGPAIHQLMAKTRGKFIITLMSSHLHRIQQAVDAAHELGRKVTFIGRSVEQNVTVALDQQKLHIPDGMMVDKKKLDHYQDSELCVVIAGSQGQEGSSLVRAIFGEHRSIQITDRDVVAFSADAIPGNQVPYYAAIDELARNGVEVYYPDIMPNLHQSGHGSAPEQRQLVETINPHYVMPIGGADRHRVKFKEFVAEPLGINKDRVLIPDSGQVISLSDGQVKMKKEFEIRPRIVDGKGIGDVGPIVLSDRRALGEAGMIVLIMPRVKKRIDVNNILVISRGFVFMKEATEVIEFIQKQTALIIKGMKGKVSDQKLRQAVEKRLGRKLYKVIQREPLIVPVIYDL